MADTEGLRRRRPEGPEGAEAAHETTEVPAAGAAAEEAEEPVAGAEGSAEAEKPTATAEGEAAAASPEDDKESGEKNPDIDPNNPYAQKKDRKGRGDKMGDDCRTFLASTKWKLIVLTVVVFVPLNSLVNFMPFCFKVMEAPFYLQAVGWTLAAWLSVQFVYNFAATQWTDPGRSADAVPPMKATNQFPLVFPDHPDCPENRQVDTDDPIAFAPNWCKHCKQWKPPRAHHCSFCKKCTLRMDHHCPFTGNCIGHHNHGHFLCMYIFAQSGLIYAAVLLVLTVWNYPQSAANLERRDTIGEWVAASEGTYVGTITRWLFNGYVTQVVMWMNFQLFVQTVAVTLGMLAVLGFGCPALNVAMANVTTLELQFPLKEYVQIKERVYCPIGPGFFNQGPKDSLLGMLGPRWWLRLLVPTNGGGPDISWAIAPVPCLSGAQALVDRVKQVREEGVKHKVESCKALGFSIGPSAKEDDAESDSDDEDHCHDKHCHENHGKELPAGGPEGVPEAGAEGEDATAQETHAEAHADDDDDDKSGDDAEKAD